MSDLPEQPLVIDWPDHVPLPLPGEKFDGGFFGIGIVRETFVRHDRSGRKPIRRIAVDFYHPIR